MRCERIACPCTLRLYSTHIVSSKIKSSTTTLYLTREAPTQVAVLAWDMGIPHFPIHPWLAGPNHLSTWDILIHIFIGIIITLYIISHRILCTHIRGNEEARKQLLLRLTQSTLLPCFSSPGISRLKTATRLFSALVAGLLSAGVARFKASAGMVATL